MIDLRPDEAATLYALSWSSARIAAVIGVTRQTILRWLVARGVVLRTEDSIAFRRLRPLTRETR
jgi:hypothetical protein